MDAAAPPVHATDTVLERIGSASAKYWHLVFVSSAIVFFVALIWQNDYHQRCRTALAYQALLDFDQEF